MNISADRPIESEVEVDSVVFLKFRSHPVSIIPIIH